MSEKTYEMLLQEAADWLAREDLGLTPEEESEFERWLEADVRHAAAWAEVKQPWQKLDEIRDEGMAGWMIAELERREQRRVTRRRYFQLGGLAAAVVFLIGSAGIYHGLNRPAESLETSAGPVTIVGTKTIQPGANETAILLTAERRVLEDGTVVDFDGDALLSVSFTDNRREVQLVNGKAYFDVFPDKSRPFVVKSGNVRVRAVGTAFAVAWSEQAADIIVTEGRVDVGRGDEEIITEKPLLLDAGNRVLMSYDAEAGMPGVEILTPDEIALRLQWRKPRLQLKGASLSQVILMLNTLNHTRIKIADPTLEQLRFSGLFRADNADGFVQMLKNNYGIIAEVHADQTIILRRQ